MAQPPANSMPTRQTSSAKALSAEKRLIFGQQFVEQLRRRELRAPLHAGDQHRLGVKLVIAVLDLVEAVGEQHDHVLRAELHLGGLVGGVFKQPQHRLALAAGIGQRFDLAGAAADMQRLGMAGVGVAHRARRPVRHQVERRGEHRRAGVLEDGVEVGVELAQELAGIRGERLELLRQRADHGRHQRRADTVPGHIADEHAGLVFGKRRDGEEIAAHGARGKVPVRELEGALRMASAERGKAGYCCGSMVSWISRAIFRSSSICAFLARSSLRLWASRALARRIFSPPAAAAVMSQKMPCRPMIVPSAP